MSVAKVLFRSTEGNGNSVHLTPSLYNLPYPFSVGDNPTTLFNPLTLQSLRHLVPNARIIVTLRNPIDKWVSWYIHSYQPRHLYFSHFVRGNYSSIVGVLTTTPLHLSRSHGLFTHETSLNIKMF